MEAIKTEIPGVLIIETDVFGDHRGYFTETYNKPKYEVLGITTEFVQDNMSFSAQKGTLRGLHWQNPPYAQAKLVSCTKGTVIDVAVDIRKGSPTFGQWVSVELSAENTFDLARLLVDMCETEKYGYYHATNEGGYISWYDFCVEFYKQYGLDTKVIPVTTEEYGLSKAARPVNSRLDKSKLIKYGFTPLPTWQDAVNRYLKEAQL